MAFDHLNRLSEFLLGQDTGDTQKYEITIKPVTVLVGGMYWRIIGVYHLTGSENGGKHNLFLDCLNEWGDVIRPARILWGWEGQRQNEIANPVVLDKPMNEPGGNIGIYWGQKIWAMPDEYPAETIIGVHTMYADEEQGNTLGHHSFYVAWQLTQSGEEPPIEEPPGEDLKAALREIRAWETETTWLIAERFKQLDDILMRYS